LATVGFWKAPDDCRGFFLGESQSFRASARAASQAVDFPLKIVHIVPERMTCAACWAARLFPARALDPVRCRKSLEISVLQ